MSIHAERDKRSHIAPQRRRLGEVLLESAVLTDEQLETALATQLQQPPGTVRRRLGSIIVELGFASDTEIAQGLATTLGLRMLDLAQTVLVPEVARLVPRAVAERYCVLATSITDGVLTVAAADPTNIVAFDDVRLYTKAPALNVVVAPESTIREHLRRLWSLEKDSSDMASMFESEDAEVVDIAAARDAAEDRPVVLLLSTILADAVRARASDVHIEPQAREVRVRYRIDGLLRDVMTVPKSVASSLVSRVKIISGLDIAERRRPQDGRARLTVDDGQVDSRVSTLPTVHGEKVVVRLMAGADNVPALNRSGLNPEQLESLLSAIVSPQGLVLITGPTGSGKTATLYAALNTIRTPDRNIVTLEDPVEIQLPGINQVQVHERSGMTFARGLRSILRQDPDVVLVGEIRDSETAELAMQASLTGHLVLSTLHANDSVRAVTRLVDIGVAPFLIASSLSLVVAQRLVRVPCRACSAPYTPSPRTLELLGLVEEDLVGGNLLRGRGCDDCGHSGYLGRTGVFEVLPITSSLRAVLLRTPSEGAIQDASSNARAGTLRSEGIAKALAGETSLEEVLRVTQVDAVEGTRCVSCLRPLADQMVCCPFCGTDIARNHCSGCSRVLEADWRVCPWCHLERTDRPRPGVAVTHAPKRPRILVVDDDPSIGQFITVVLMDDADVLVAGTAEEALRLAASEDLDAVVLDLGLPDLPGIELARLLRSDTRTAVLPILMLSGRDIDRLAGEARHAGADDWLSKPVEPDLLRERILHLVRQVTLS